jgi:hypothetical protein
MDQGFKDWIDADWVCGTSDEPPILEFRRWFPMGIPTNDKEKQWTNEMRQQNGIREEV